MARTTFGGPVASRMHETDGQIFIPATLEYSFGGTWTKTRTGVGNYNMLKTAGADTTQTAFDIGRALFRKIGTDPNNLLGIDTQEGGSASAPAAARIRGVQLVSVTPVWKNTTADLTSGTVSLTRTTHVGGVIQTDPSLAFTPGGALTGATLTVTANAGVRAETVTVATPYIIGNNLSLVTDWCEIIWIAAAGSVLTVYGLFVNFNYNLL